MVLSGDPLFVGGESVANHQPLGLGTHFGGRGLTTSTKGKYVKSAASGPQMGREYITYLSSFSTNSAPGPHEGEQGEGVSIT